MKDIGMKKDNNVNIKTRLREVKEKIGAIAILIADKEVSSLLAKCVQELDDIESKMPGMGDAKLLNLIESVLRQRMDDFYEDAKTGDDRALGKRTLLGEFLFWIRDERAKSPPRDNTTPPESCHRQDCPCKEGG